MTCCNILETLTLPALHVRTYTHWSLYLRSRVKTLGTSALITNEHYSKMSEIPETAFTELYTITRQLESIFDSEFHPNKYNYQMNMMKESHTHFNIFPRYAQSMSFLDVEWQDSGWPVLVGENLMVEQGVLEKVAEILRAKFA